eukprot:TRINITY_DN15394_c0_g1_i1.p1 TRINITY_DN15394_c0_g1~~TRINITY_DN15394_c0_g1_i1.p1  ORF type:complete len:105 (-),score=7.69 TRINITY_DN15394_c0_g1_i1:34-348(-)
MVIVNELPTFVCKVLCADRSEGNEILSCYLRIAKTTIGISNMTKEILTLLQLDQWKLALQILLNESEGLVQAPRCFVLGFELVSAYLNEPVSYTHLTLPTTPYV